MVRKALILQPSYPGLYSQLALVDILRHDGAAALRNAVKETDPTLRVWTIALVEQISPDRKRAGAALRDYAAKNGKAQPYLTADLYALRQQADPMFRWLERARVQRDPNLALILLNDPFMFPYWRDARFPALCKQLGLPVPSGAPPVAIGR